MQSRKDRIVIGSGRIYIGGTKLTEVRNSPFEKSGALGAGHKRLECSDDFSVIGAYPNGQNYDFCYGCADERPDKLENIKQVPLPDNDPLFGKNGPLFSYWQN
ncbi:hypothetical protein GCM10009001_08900 [Virgibacillus siamensis]|uniref:Uncharacterized protein n=1 Tax=Virgibacillus siamensis TaxID=480071 RepID=A0ABN1FPH0_9BACI